MRTEIDLNESENDLNECEHFLKANWDRSKLKSIWMWTLELRSPLNGCEMDLNESEMDLNECEHFLKANLNRSNLD